MVCRQGVGRAAGWGPSGQTAAVNPRRASVRGGHRGTRGNASRGGGRFKNGFITQRSLIAFILVPFQTAATSQEHSPRVAFPPAIHVRLTPFE